MSRKWLNTRQKSCSKCLKIYIACLTLVNTESKWTTDYLSRLISSTLMSRNINLLIGQNIHKWFPLTIDFRFNNCRLLFFFSKYRTFHYRFKKKRKRSSPKVNLNITLTEAGILRYSLKQSFFQKNSAFHKFTGKQQKSLRNFA